MKTNQSDWTGESGWRCWLDLVAGWSSYYVGGGWWLLTREGERESRC